MRDFDTIAAISTGISEGGISIIRISGSNSLSIINKIFVGIGHRSVADIKSYTLRYGNIISSENNEVIDEVIVSYMKEPKSFTMEDVVEINCHGGLIASRKVLEEVLRNGARLAEPGEFTKRAFLNGRIDLSQAEAVIDIIRAKTDLSMKSALNQSSGKISREISGIRSNILKTIAHIEAAVDFPEEDLEEITSKEAKQYLIDIEERLKFLIETAEEGKIIREGLSAVIVGKPNVGKSSLLNELIQENKAIVTEIPGTTRDIIEEYINIDGIPVKIVDTAGIRETEDLVEKMGVQKTKEKIDEADLILFMLDSSRNIDEEDKEIIRYIKDKKYIILLNKSDITDNFDLKSLNELEENRIISCSVKYSLGIDNIKNKIKELFFNGEIKSNDIFITSVRHKEALVRARDSISLAIVTLDNSFAIDLASIDIKNAWSYLGEITGETLDENIIDKIFSEFCIGK